MSGELEGKLPPFGGCPPQTHELNILYERHTHLAGPDGLGQNHCFADSAGTCRGAECIPEPTEWK